MLSLHKIGLAATVLAALMVGIALAVPTRDRPDTAVVEVLKSRVVLAPAAPAAAAPVPAVQEPAWKAEFRKAYGLKDGELVRRVAPPYPDCRAEYFKDQVRELYKRIKKDPPAEVLNTDYTDHFTKFGWKDGWPVDELTMQNTPVKPDVGARLVQLIHMTTGFDHTRTEGDAGLLEEKVTGDFVVRAGAEPEKVAAALEKILRKECGVPVMLSVKEVERDVYFLSGKYEAKPLTGRKVNQIEVYAVKLQTDGGGGGSGSLSKMAAAVEAFVEVCVVVGEVTGVPKQLEWHFNRRSPATAQERAQDHDPETVVKNIADQTGLTAKREKRTLKVLTVMVLPLPKDPPLAPPKRATTANHNSASGRSACKAIEELVKVAGAQG